MRFLVGWIDEGTTARVKGTKEIVELLPDGPPFEYYVAPGRRCAVPKFHLRCVGFKMFFVLKDGQARYAKGGKDLMCAHCFALRRMPKHGEENLPR